MLPPTVATCQTFRDPTSASQHCASSGSAGHSGCPAGSRSASSARVAVAAIVEAVVADA